LLSEYRGGAELATRPNPNFQIRISPKLKHLLEVEAARRGLRLTEFARQVLAERMLTGASHGEDHKN
jgi:predicted HicB family RNase H-like nuclease